MKYQIKGNGDALAHNPYWIGLVVPFKQSETYTESDQSQTDPVETDDLIVLEDDIIQWNFSSSKESFSGAMQMSLHAAAPIDKFNPEDWMVFWSFDNEEDYSFIKDGLKKLADKNNDGAVPSLNDFKNGPKFLGQIASIVKNEQIMSSGAINLSYQVTAHSFTPFGTNQWFDPTLNVYNKNAATWWSNFSSFPFLQNNVHAGIIPSQKALISLLMITFATGPDNLNELTAGSTLGPVSPNRKFLIPEVLIKIFKNYTLNGAFSQATNRNYTYVDLLNAWFGTQKYPKDSQKASADIIEVFVPQNLSGDAIKNTSSIFETSDDLEGQLRLGPLNFSNQNTWSILDSYLNKPINEMYTAMRPNKNGKLMPTLVARQTPLPLRAGFEKKIEAINAVKSKSVTNKPDGEKSNPNDPNAANLIADGPLSFLFQDKAATYFDELPTWEIDTQYVTSINVGKAGSAKINFVSLTPFNGVQDQGQRDANNAYLSLPIVDNIDIQRNGLRPIIGSIPGAWLTDLNGDISTRNGFANQLMAAISFNGHLKLSGTITCYGLQLPIQHGDNVKVDNITYHIERIIHTGQISMDGRKSFFTQLVVSSGIVVNTDGTHKYALLGEARHNITKE